MDNPKANFGLRKIEFDQQREALTTGNEQLMQRIFNTHHRTAISNLTAHGATFQDAQDAVAETLAIYSSILLKKDENGQFQTQYDNLVGHFNRVAARFWSAQHRRHSPTNDLPEDEGFFVARDLVDENIGLRALLNQDVLQPLQQTLTALCDRCRTLLERHYFNEERLVDLWQPLGDASANAITVRLHGCRKKFKDIFQKSYQQ